MYENHLTIAKSSVNLEDRKNTLACPAVDNVLVNFRIAFCNKASLSMTLQIILGRDDRNRNTYMYWKRPIRFDI